MRLIDEDKVLEKLEIMKKKYREYFEQEDLRMEDKEWYKGKVNAILQVESMITNINIIPTAYDVDKVVEQILNITVDLFAGRSNGKTLFAKTLSEYRQMVVDIVKEGGINDINNN